MAGRGRMEGVCEMHFGIYVDVCVDNFSVC